METLAKISQDVHRAHLNGGGLLTYLHEKAMNSIGDARQQELALHLAQVVRS